MKKFTLFMVFLVITGTTFSQKENDVLNFRAKNQDSLVLSTCDGTPQYRESVEASYRMLQYRTSIYGDVPDFGTGIRLGIYQVQAYSGKGATAKNMTILEEAVKQAKKFDVQLLSFPELFVPGYTLSPEEAKQVAEYKDGPSITIACKLAKAYNMALIVPYAEKVDESGDTNYYDAIAIISEQGELLNSYRKTHLYGQQERDNWCFGTSDYPVYPIFGFPVGVLNCYECEFPELQRILALHGAKLIVGPTAADNYYRLPSGERSSVPYPDIATLLIPANAYANNIFFAYANRCGYEVRGTDAWHYRGNSIICGPYGDIIVAAGHEQNTLLISDCVPAYYGMTHPAPKYNYLQDRRPDLYHPLVLDKAKFFNPSEESIDLNSDFFKGGYTYPDFDGCKETPAGK
ncbi:MAG: carbon-nitrogen hydrolase family protein [Bacteroidales bacterium]|nr:carbon-nitrogen hydrolase family protein [Bacteroidales bacterium]